MTCPRIAPAAGTRRDARHPDSALDRVMNGPRASSVRRGFSSWPGPRRVIILTGELYRHPNRRIYYA